MDQLGGAVFASCGRNHPVYSISPYAKKSPLTLFEAEKDMSLGCTVCPEQGCDRKHHDREHTAELIPS